MDEETVVFLKALASETRQRMLAHFSGAGELSAGEIAERNGLSPSTASEHLRLLHRGGLVDARKEGKQIYYRVADATMDQRLAALQEYLAHCRLPAALPVGADAGAVGGTEANGHEEIESRERGGRARTAVWGRLKASASAMQAQLASRKHELRSGAFRDASMAMCALVAAADGIIDPAEQVRVAQLIAHNEVLQNFAADDLQRRFEDNLDRLALNFDHGKTAVLHEVGKAKKKPTEARAVIQIGIIIGGADGAFIESEQAVVREACHALGLPPQEFGLCGDL